MSTFNERLLADLQQPSFRRRLNKWMEQADDCFIVYTKPRDAYEDQRQWIDPERDKILAIHNGTD